MSFSLNEVEATAKKATRGAGYHWGLAEEAGKAVRWLCAHGVDGCGALAEALGKFDGASLSNITPATNSSEWYATGRTLCPLMTGTALSDRVDAIQNSPIRASRVAAPNLLLFFAANMAAHCKSVVTLEWPGGFAVTNGSDLCINGRPAGSFASVVRVLCGGTLGAPVSTSTRAEPAATVWKTLNTFAHRTYAPATEESRLKGAGAGTTDRD
ncbi:MAG: DUF3726 domain-containing protein [Paracoccaceae bacterium]